MKDYYKSSIKYLGKSYVPNSFLNCTKPEYSYEKIIIFEMIYHNEVDGKTKTSNFQFFYTGKDQQRVSFRAAKLMGMTASILAEHNCRIESIPPKTFGKIIKDYANLFEMKIVGLEGLTNAKRLITDKILKDIIKMPLNKTNYVIHDIDVGNSFSIVRSYAFKSHYRRI